MTRVQEYRRAQLLALRPPLAHGGHYLVIVAWSTDNSPTMWKCLGCCAIAPDWVWTEGLWMPMFGRWCPGLLAALPPGTPAPNV